MELSETLLGKYGDEGDKLIFQVLDSGEKPIKASQQKLSKINLKEVFREVTKELIIELVENLEDFGSNQSLEFSEGLIEQWLLEKSSLIGLLDKGIQNDVASSLAPLIYDFYINSIYYKWRHGRADQSRVEFFNYVTNPPVRKRLIEESLTSFERKYTSELSKYEDLSRDIIIGRKELYTSASEKALRYDLTVPLARFVVQNQNELSFPFKRYQIQPVWRADRPQKGRYREFYQCDVDVIGSDSLLNEAELLCIIDEVFTNLGLSDVRIRINNRKILSGIAASAGISEHFQTMTVAIDKLDKIGVDGVKEEMLRNGLPEAGVKKVLNLIKLKGEATGTLKMLAGAVVGSEEAYKGIDEVKSVLKALPEAVREKVELDLTLARGLNYYTGAIIEVGHDDFPSSICGGGRYDDLTGIFGLNDMSGVGVSFGADRIYDLMEEKNLFPETLKAASQVLFVNFGKEEVMSAIRLAADLRTEGLSAEVYPDEAKMKKQMKYANDKGVRFVVIIGEEEHRAKTATVKDMLSGEQDALNQKDLVSFINDKLS